MPTRPGAVPGRDPTTSRSTGSSAGITSSVPAPAASVLGGLAGGRIDVATGDRDAGQVTFRAITQVGGGDGHGHRRAVEQALGRRRRVDRARAECASPSRRRPCRRPRARPAWPGRRRWSRRTRRGGHVGLLEPLGAALEQRLRLALEPLLAIGVFVDDVAHVGQRDLGAPLGEQAAEHQRVGVVWSSVVAEDELGSHVVLLHPGVARYSTPASHLPAISTSEAC